MSEFLYIDIKTLENGIFKFYQTGLICKVLEVTGMGRGNFFPTLTKFEAPLGTDENGTELREI